MVEVSIVTPDFTTDNTWPPNDYNSLTIKKNKYEYVNPFCTLSPQLLHVVCSKSRCISKLTENKNNNWNFYGFLIFATSIMFIHY